jgi:hypothetical protein
MNRLAICCACIVLALGGCASTIPSVDPSAYTPPSGGNGTLYGTVVGAGSFEILTSDGRTYAVTVHGSTATPQLFIIVDRGRAFSIRKVIIHRADGNESQWTGMDMEVLVSPGTVGYLGRFTFTNDRHNLTIDRKSQREDLALLKATR